MALGTITQLNVNPQLSSAEPGAAQLGPLKVTRNTVVGDSSYATGGSALTPSQLGFGSEGVILWADVQIHASSGSNDGASSARYDEVNHKLQAWNAGAEVAASTNLSGITWEIVAYGYPLS